MRISRTPPSTATAPPEWVTGSARVGEIAEDGTEAGRGAAVTGTEYPAHPPVL
jgi:hypothetical protein